MIKYVRKILFVGLAVFIALSAFSPSFSKQRPKNDFTDEIFVETADWKVVGIRRRKAVFSEREGGYEYIVSYIVWEAAIGSTTVDVPPLNAKTIYEAIEDDLVRPGESGR